MPKIKKVRTDILSHDEVGEMIKATDKLMIKTLISILYNYGMRISEALQLKRSDIWIKNNYLYIRPITLKSKVEKVIPDKRTLKRHNNSAFIKYIIRYINYMDENKYPKDTYLFQSPYNINKPYSRRHILNILTSLNPTVWCHLFRHTRATLFGNMGATSSQLMAWFGWTDPRPTTRYILKSEKLIQTLADEEVN